MVNYFKDHLWDHSAIAKPLYDILTATTRKKIKLLTWTNEDHLVFERLKASVNVCLKLYSIDYSSRIILCTDASDFAHGTYVCQLRPLPNEGVVEEPIRFLGGIFHGRQTRLSTIEKEAYAIYWATCLAAFTLRYEQTTGTFFS